MTHPAFTRREFVRVSTAAGAAAGLAAATPSLLGASWLASTKPLSILILGGTGFIGPAIIDAAQARGHQVTLFNRGRREKLVGVRDNTESLYGNRDPNKHAQSKFVDGKEVDDESSPKGLSALEGKKFDAVVDNSGYVPRIVKASAELLAPNVGQYVFISSISVYANHDTPGADESDALGTIADPTVEEMGAQFENYGPLKVLCEKAAETALPGRATIIRPGYIVGPGDTTDRFTYWPVRMLRSGKEGWGTEVLCPGTPNDPVQFIDVRDLAEFVVRCVESKAVGPFNATGPADPLTNGAALAACSAAAKAVGATDATMTWASYEWLEKNAGNASFPILLPVGYHNRSVAKAVAAGLKFRTTLDTCKAILEWWPKAVALRSKVAAEVAAAAQKDGRPVPPPSDPNRLRAGLTAEQESTLLAAWHKEHG